MGETPTGALSIDDLAAVAADLMLGDSPLAHSLRRRRTEADSVDEAFAGHDSLI